MSFSLTKCSVDRVSDRAHVGQHQPVDLRRGRCAGVERASEPELSRLTKPAFELALKNFDAAGGQDTESVRKGVELVYAELLGVLEKAGLSRVEAEGKPFDPNVHEAVMQEEGDGEPVVTDVLRTGYTLKGRVLRPAMVKVSR